VLPAFGNVREAMWRGIISKEEFGKFIVWHDYKPEPRPGIALSDKDIMSQLAYELPGRIDARWMLRWGIIDTQRHKELTKMRGIHPDWLDDVSEAEWMNMLIDERTALRTIYVRQFRIGVIDEEELRRKLRACYYSQRECEWIIQRAKVEYELDELEDRLRATKEAFRRDLVSKEEYLQILLKEGIPEERARLIVDAEAYKKLPRPRVS